MRRSSLLSKIPVIMGIIVQIKNAIKSITYKSIISIIAGILDYLYTFVNLIYSLINFSLFIFTEFKNRTKFIFKVIKHTY